MKTLILALVITIVTASGMAQAAAPQHDMSQMAMQPDVSKARHQGVGIVKAINAKAHKVQIAHEAIADLNWPPMTMWFALHNPLPKDIRVGDAVRFDLMEGAKQQWMVVKIEKK